MSTLESYKFTFAKLLKQAATLVLLLVCSLAIAQVDQSISKSSSVQVEEISFTIDSIPDLDLDEEITKLEDEFNKKKKTPKKIFYGKKCRKSFTKRGAGKRQTLELFFYLKKPADPDFYVQDVYVWDIQKGQVIEISKKEKFDPRFHKILHGPYKKTVGGQLAEQGIFYVGTKHGRWETYSAEKKETFNDEEVAYSLLEDKKKYYKGWPKECQLNYYDNTRKKVKEVIPYENGVLHGQYFMFLENGQLFIRGQYQNGKKIGLWIENYKTRDKRRVETQYPESSLAEGEPYILNEWDEKNIPLIINGKKVEPGEKIETDPIKKHFQKKGKR
jgi:antitoxin component YwqK of YwqJK toxin-antitoxin module